MLLSLEEQLIHDIVAQRINESDKQITDKVNALLAKSFSNQDQLLTERLKESVTLLLDANSVETKQSPDPVELQKHWVRIFAANLITKDTVQNSVKLSIQLWDALEAEFSKTNVIH